MAAAPGTVVIEKDNVTNLIGGNFRVDGVSTSRITGHDTNKGVGSKACRRIILLEINRIPASAD